MTTITFVWVGARQEEDPCRQRLTRHPPAGAQRRNSWHRPRWHRRLPRRRQQPARHARHMPPAHAACNQKGMRKDIRMHMSTDMHTHIHTDTHTRACTLLLRLPPRWPVTSSACDALREAPTRASGLGNATRGTGATSPVAWGQYAKNATPSAEARLGAKMSRMISSALPELTMFWGK